jgi:NAD(P)-dependent dehydrogenase (short-subunit alcohol dehydrogenase family)
MTPIHVPGSASFPELFGLAGKAVLVTGSTRGIGLAMATLFAEAGARVVVTGEIVDECAAVQADLAAKGLPVEALVCDVADPASLKGLIASAEAHLGPLDVLVCNAGVSLHHGPMGEVSGLDYDRMFEINLNHAFRLCQDVAPAMASRGGGSIVLTASIAGLRGSRALGVYGMTKAALIQLARNVAVEFGPQGVRCNALAPGLTATSWASAILSSPEAAELRLRGTPLRRIAQPREIAAAALFLASDAAGFITGHALVADGGALISDGS